VGSHVHWNIEEPDRIPLVPELAFQEWRAQGMLDSDDFPAYLEAYKKCGRLLAPGPGLAQLPSTPYIVLHVRRHRVWNTSRYMVDIQNVWLDTLTLKAVEALLQNAAAPLLILSDTAFNAVTWRRAVPRIGATLKKSAPHVLGFEGGPRRTKNVIYDFFVMSKAAGIIASIPSRGGWSSFSAIPALVADLPYMTVHDPEMDPEFSRQDTYACSDVGCLQNFFRWGHPQVDRYQEMEHFTAEIARRDLLLQSERK
jgi:hypothetical protein